LAELKKTQDELEVT
jgi:hypothetical protein